ncbi:heterokaryon incompatibility protein [Colletotrichum chrysophilum]|uniref:Heterokaryon incompatibility protein n=1 Tax=Colletotrichum chrysophilum TaxID=1836956 RepID=A0AAD9AWL5_9PEZI|nr:heterokaryon incompatibility protein [Colletotrichum chrysophilum]
MELSSAKFPVKIPESTTFKWIGLASIWFSIRQPSAWLRQTSLAAGLPEYATFINRVIDYYLRMYWMLIGTFLFFLVAILLFVLYRLVGALFLELVRADLGPYINEWPSWARWLRETEVDLPWAWLQALGILVLLLGSIPAVSFGNNDQLQLGGKMNSVEAIIQEIRTRKATNPKDQSYGMHAILQKLGLSLTTPDYSRDLGDIQKELFVQLLIWTKSMNLLLCANGPRADGKPSWVPDRQLDSEEMWLKPSQLFGRAGNNTTPDSDPWWVLHDDDRLVVRGRKIHRVDWCGGPFEHTDTVMDYSGTHLHNIIILRDQHRANVERVNAGWGSVFVDTSLRRIHYVDMTEKPARFSNFEHLWALWDGLVRSGDNILVRDVLESMLATPELMEFHTSICNEMAKKGRSVFVTAPHPLATGNCPANTKVGDVIFLVAGVPMPLVLREVSGSDNYQLIGFALVDALMWGQGWGAVVEDDLQEIALC